ncbi:hypothetical protein STRDD12_01243 [Streptococcus sp. DD12]|nr:hypothetical protein STRDD12_01243 [Streptococcus sp. DD12]
MNKKNQYWLSLIIGVFLFLYSLFRLGATIYRSEFLFSVLWLIFGLANAYNVYRIWKTRLK